MNSQQLTEVFIRANVILSASVLRADKLRQQAKDIKHTTNTATWIKNMAKKDQLLLRAERTEMRGRKVWDSVVSFQGKYVNWKHLTSDNKPIFDIQLSISDMYETILPKAKKLAY
jgi:hypothetical protein